MWDPGSSAARACVLRVALGFTLLELLLVVAIMAIASAGVMLAMRAPEQTLLAREADRLSAMLESARAESRVSGVPVTWHADVDGFRFAGLVPSVPPVQQPPADGGGTPVTPWLTQGVLVQGGGSLSLGPEPIIGPQSVVLALGSSSLRIASDGLRPFVVEPDASAANGNP